VLGVIGVAVGLGIFVGGCSDAGDRNGRPDPSESFVIPTLPAADSAAAEGSGSSAAPLGTQADVVRAAEAAESAAGGQAIDASVDLMGYVVQLRQDDGTFTTVQLDVGFGVVFIEDSEPGGRADELGDAVDMARAVDIAQEVAAAEAIGAARDGVVVGVELEPGEYDVDIQYPDGRVLEVRIDDTTFEPTGTRIREG
jgi:uncharacterized membrane protein YkoI